MKNVVIIGAGFSGISAAYYLNREGFNVEIFEKEPRPGGLIDTVKTKWGPCELAANGILNSKRFEELAKEIKIDLIPTQKLSRRRYIFRDKPKRWPLNFRETLILVFKFIFSKRKPREGESILSWGNRTLGVQGTQYLLAPVLQGIYAGDISKLSASLILKRFFYGTKKPFPQIRGLVSPKGGMIEFFNKAESYLKSRGVKFFYNKTVSIEKDKNIYVIATSSNAAAEILESKNFALAQEIQTIENLSLLKVTAFFKNDLKGIKGFGVLFPKGQKFRALGVLFNNFIFKGASENHLLSESFIYGGELVSLSESEILRHVAEDRRMLYGQDADMEGFYIQRWPYTLPHYTIQLETKLKKISPELALLEREGIFIIGNFLGGIGLSQLHERAALIPERIKNLHG